ncbi:OLC1v1012908C1 [Oldenlandia corymbosa var. corymbosa]|uniref:OLC1v1012908C1 n=1 Tax=Oldenlandia corymbosa var. corymbosa TaxID=529605 RepID=A0AAV1DX46_OLDCO|nr:OLC1v1012908C1 [Oldenlandia corymbosa var. corymbosa]
MTTISLSLSPIPRPISISVIPFPAKLPSLQSATFDRRRLLLPLTSVFARAKSKELILGNPSVTVEKGKYSYDVETLINKLSSLPPRGSIARCLDAFKNKLSLSDFSLVFKEFAARGDWQRSLRLFKYMQRQLWCKPNEHIYTLMIGILGREGLLEKAYEVFEEMPEHNVVRTVLSYTSIINAFGRNGQYETSLKLLREMKKERIMPSILTYNTTINACARGGYEWEGLLGLFAEMRHEGIQPDLVTYNTLLSACANRKLGDEAEMVFRTMNESGVLPDITTFSYLVETFGKLGKLEKVTELLREMEEDGNLPEITSYNVLLEAYADLGLINEALGVFRQMQAAGCMPNASTYSILLNLYGTQGRYDEVRNLFLEMKVSNTEPDAATYNILIQVFGEGGYFKEVVTLFHDMVEEIVEPNMETYEGLIYSCGKGGLHEDARRILLHMNGKGVVPSSKAWTGVIEAYGQAGLYEEALVAFNTMNEVGSIPTVEAYNSLLHAFAKGGLYKECEAITARMGEHGVQRNSDSFNAVIEGYRQGGKFEDAMKAYVEMEKARCDPDEFTLEAVLSVYCFAGLTDESEQQFQEIKELGILPSIMCYCMMLAVYARSARWDKAYELLNEMLSTKASNVHQVIGQMIKGDFDDENNWQMVEYVFDKLSSEGCSLGMRFYNTLLEALWWLGQKERAARVLDEATKRGIFPGLFRLNKLVWSVDVHRWFSISRLQKMLFSVKEFSYSYKNNICSIFASHPLLFFMNFYHFRMWPGGACTAVSVWLKKMQEISCNEEELPHLATVVLVRGQLESSSIAQDFPVAKAADSLLRDTVSSTFGFPGWNNGRIVCQKSQLKRILFTRETSSEGTESDFTINLSNSPFPFVETKTSRNEVKRRQQDSADNEAGIRKRMELTASSI